MRRATFVLASGLAAAVLAGALLYDRDSLPSSAGVRPDQEAAQPQQAASAATEPNKSDVAPKEEALGQNEQPPTSRVNDEIRRQRRPQQDEAAVRARIREQAAEDVRDGYALLLEDLALEKQENADLVALLTEMNIEGTWSGTIRGRTIPDQERYERIAAVIGDQKLLAFIALEENRQAYWETTQIARLLRRQALPLTDKQRDGVFEALVEVNARYPQTPPPGDVDNDSEEWIEHVLAQYDEHDRHVIELAPSVLSQDQVVGLFNQYQRMSRERVDSVERSRKLKAERPGVGWFFTPGSWN